MSISLDLEIFEKKYFATSFYNYVSFDLLNEQKNNFLMGDFTLPFPISKYYIALSRETALLIHKIRY